MLKYQKDNSNKVKFAMYWGKSSGYESFNNGKISPTLITDGSLVVCVDQQHNIRNHFSCNK